MIFSPNEHRFVDIFIISSKRFQSDFSFLFHNVNKLIRSVIGYTKPAINSQLRRVYGMMYFKESTIPWHRNRICIQSIFKYVLRISGVRMFILIRFQNSPKKWWGSYALSADLSSRGLLNHFGA